MGFSRLPHVVMLQLYFSGKVIWQDLDDRSDFLHCDTNIRFQITINQDESTSFSLQNNSFQVFLYYLSSQFGFLPLTFHNKMDNRLKSSIMRTPKSHILIEHESPEQRMYKSLTSRPLHKKILSVSISKHPKNPGSTSQRFSPRPPSPDMEIPNPVVRKSTKSFPPILAYSVSTHHGLYRLINQDKISIHLGRFAVFAVFDGYNGPMASDFLKDKMVNELLREKRSDMEALLNQIYQRIDAELVAKLKDATDNSGSSALLCIVNQNLLYVANVGTSFAFGRSSKDGSIIKLNNQHNCDNPAEYARVTSAGGRVFQTKVSLRSSPKKFIEGPMRVHPYGLTVTRTMGHFQSKTRPTEYLRSDTGPVISCKPQIRYVKVDELEWVCLCSQGLMNTLTPAYILQIITTLDHGNLNSHDFLQRCVQEIMKAALKKGCRENATIVLIQFARPIIEEPSKQATQIIEKKISLKYIGRKSTIKMQK